MLAIRTLCRHGGVRPHTLHVPVRRCTSFSHKIYFTFKKHLALFNSITSGLFMGLGDFIQQQIEMKFYDKLHDGHDWKRISHMFIVGCIIGPFHHIYYLKLDRLLPGYSLKVVLQKIALDQFLCAPLTIIMFFFLHGILERKDMKLIGEEIRQKGLVVYLGDWCFWPPTQFVNFYFIPWQYQVTYINFMTMIFNVFLSYAKYDKSDK